MRIYLQTPPTQGEALRFYQLAIQQDLFAGWNLIREWGYQGSSGRMVRTHFDEYAQAQQAMINTRDRQIKRGYHVVFTQGT